jgi:hypothetical protein
MLLGEELELLRAKLVMAKKEEAGGGGGAPSAR